MAFQHVTCRSSAYHLRDLRCSPPLLDRLYRPIALHFDTLHVRRRPLLVEKRHILCFAPYLPTRCFARPQHEPVQPRIRHLAHRFHLICPYFFISWYFACICCAERREGLCKLRALGPTQCMPAFTLLVPLDLQVVLVNRRIRYGIFATPPLHSRYVYLISIVICTVCN